MSPEQRQFLSLAILPARLSQEETAWYLGFQLHDIRQLVNAGVLTPLGHAKPNSIKYFALAELERLRADTKRLSRATDAVQTGWQRKNQREWDHYAHNANGEKRSVGSKALNGEDSQTAPNHRSHSA